MNCTSLELPAAVVVRYYLAVIRVCGVPFQPLHIVTGAGRACLPAV